MTPKKKSMVDPIVYGVCLLVVLYVAMHGATVYEYIRYMIDTGEIEQSAQIITFINMVSERVVVSPFDFVITQYTKTYLMYGAFGWLDRKSVV